MGMLAEKQNEFNHIRSIIDPVLNYFDNQKIADDLKIKIAAAADSAFVNRLLLEKFELWNAEHDDEVFLFHINRLLEQRSQKKLEKNDYTEQRTEIENSIKEQTRDRQKKIFGERITTLALHKKLLTNESLGEFLEVSAEQARRFKSGENKPQLTTLQKIADKFKVSVGYLIGLEE